MTRENINRWMPLVMAYASGKTVQRKYDSTWDDQESPLWDGLPEWWRVKPEPRRWWALEWNQSPQGREWKLYESLDEAKNANLPCYHHLIIEVVEVLR